MDLISLQNISVDTRLKDISFTLKEGEILGLIGPNGAGKSTLLNTIVGIEEYLGDILLESKPISTYTPKQRARLIGLQPQAINSVWSLSVADVVALGRMPWGDENQEAINSAMHKASIADFAERKINELSGGERARVWLARVLAGDPKILLADEPISSLDIHYQLEVMNLLKEFKNAGNSVIVSLHDLSLAARYCDRLCLLNKGKLVALGGVKNVLTHDILNQCYGIPVDIDLNRQPPLILPA